MGKEATPRRSPADRRLRPGTAETRLLLFTAKRQKREDPWLQRFADKVGVSSPQHEGAVLRLDQVFSPPPKIRAAGSPARRRDNGLSLNPFIVREGGPQVEVLPYGINGREVNRRRSSVRSPRASQSGTPRAWAPPMPRLVSPVKKQGFGPAPGLSAPLGFVRSPSAPSEMSLETNGITYTAHTNGPSSMNTAGGSTSTGILRRAQRKRLMAVSQLADGCLARLVQRPPSPQQLSARLEAPVEGSSPRRGSQVSFAQRVQIGTGVQWIPGAKRPTLIDLDPALSEAVVMHVHQDRLPPQGKKRKSQKRASILLQDLAVDTIGQSGFESPTRSTTGGDLFNITSPSGSPSALLGATAARLYVGMLGAPDPTDASTQLPSPRSLVVPGAAPPSESPRIRMPLPVSPSMNSLAGVSREFTFGESATPRARSKQQETAEPVTPRSKAVGGKDLSPHLLGNVTSVPAARWLLRHGTGRIRSASRARGAQISFERFTRLRDDFERADTEKKGRLALRQAAGMTFGGRFLDAPTFQQIDRDATGYITAHQLVSFLYPTAPPAEIQAREREWKACRDWEAQAKQGKWAEKYPPSVVNEVCELFGLLDPAKKFRLNETDFIRFATGADHGSKGGISSDEATALYREHSNTVTGQLHLGGLIEIVKHAYPEAVDDDTDISLLQPADLEGPGRHAPVTRMIRLHQNPFTAIKAKQLKTREDLLRSKKKTEQQREAK
eukprot:Hpha_TRINITY_DN9950_c0_g2::TRINITY_DN9950_c0_g2_i1::g.140459::m.140459